MTNKEAIDVLNMVECHNPLTQQAKEKAIQALETMDAIRNSVYRNENCSRKRTCIDYKGFHCAGCNGCFDNGGKP